MSLTNEQIEDLTKKLQDFEATLEPKGWDAPAVLAILADTGNGVEIVEPFEFEGHPVQLLTGIYNQGATLVDKADGLVLFSESWGVSEAEHEKTGLMPSESPNRTEMRFGSAMLRDGTMIQVMRTRGKDTSTTMVIRPTDEHHDRAMRANIPAGLYAVLTGDASYFPASSDENDS